MLRTPGFDISREHTWVDHASQVDFPRMKKGGLDGGFFVIFVPQRLLDQELRAYAAVSYTHLTLPTSDLV